MPASSSTSPCPACLAPQGVDRPPCAPPTHVHARTRPHTARPHARTRPARTSIMTLAKPTAISPVCVCGGGGVSVGVGGRVVAWGTRSWRHHPHHTTPIPGLPPPPTASLLVGLGQLNPLLRPPASRPLLLLPPPPPPTPAASHPRRRLPPAVTRRFCPPLMPLSSSLPTTVFITWSIPSSRANS